MVRMMTGLSNLVVSYTPAVKLLLMIVLTFIINRMKDCYEKRKSSYDYI